METVKRVLAGGLLWHGGISWWCLYRNLLKMGSLGNRSQVCGQLGQELEGQGAPMEAEWATSHG